MERDREVTKLVNVLHRITRAASYAAWSDPSGDGVRFCAQQYNKVLARLRDIEPSVATLFVPLSETAPPQVTRLAANELAAYFDDETERETRQRRPHRERHCGGRRGFVGVARGGDCW